MTHGIESVKSSDSIEFAATRMKDLDIGSLAVFQNGNPVGMITDRDITVRVVGRSRSPAQTKVEEAMTKSVAMCDENADIEEAARIMKECKIRRLLVKNSQNIVSGIITIDDIALRGGCQMVTEVLKQVKQRIGPKR